MSSPTPELTDPYSALAIGYDVVMSHVDYEAWATYIHALLARHHPQARFILELGCGTATLALSLQPMGGYEYLATDRSGSMVEVARRKIAREQVPIEVKEKNFTSFETPHPVDVVLLLYDGLNYLLKIEDVKRMLLCAARSLRAQGVAIFDQSTPLNSLNNEEDFEDNGTFDGFSFVRRSRYDNETRLHTTVFEIEWQKQFFIEEHVQRAYEIKEIGEVVKETPFRIEALYDGFTGERAHQESERVHWVLRKEE